MRKVDYLILSLWALTGLTAIGTYIKYGGTLPLILTGFSIAGALLQLKQVKQ